MTIRFGSIISGTLDMDELLDAFSDQIESLQLDCETTGWDRPENFPQRDAAESLLWDIRERSNEIEDDDKRYLFDEAIGLLNDYAPSYCYFGARAGDPADFGYWLHEDWFDQFDGGLIVTDTSEVPGGYSGEVMHVNDHGNVTLYTAQDGKLTEVWSIV